MKRKAPALAWPFACLGLYGGWLSGHLTVGNESAVHLLVLLTLFTPLTCAALGGYLSDKLRPRWVLRTIITTIVAGVLNGLFVGAFTGAGAGMMIGLGCGFFFSLPFVPATLLVAGHAHRVGRADERSLVDAADRRAVWRAVALAVSLASLTTLGGHPSSKVVLVCLAAALGALVLMVLDLFALDAAARLGRVVARSIPYDESRHGPLPVSGLRVDALGLGEDLRVELATSQSPYRDADRVSRVIKGDPAASRHMLARAAIADGVVMVVALLCALAFTCL